MTKALLKNTFRDIMRSKARFFSILTIIGLGVGFFAGIKSTAPSMYSLAESYYSSNNLMDYRIVSTVGFDEEDIEAVAKMEGVTDVMPSNFCDVMETAEAGGEIIHIISSPKSYNDNSQLNKVVVKKGRLPEKSGEIVVEDGTISKKKYKIGDTVEIAPMAGDTDVKSALKVLKYKVVGIAGSPLYISYQRGSTTIGDGKISQFMYIYPDDFKYERYTELYIKTDASRDYSAFSNKYTREIDNFTSALEKKGKVQCNSFKNSIIDEINKKIRSARSKYNSQHKKAYKNLARVKKTLKDSEKAYYEKISQTENDLSASYNKIISGQAELNRARANYYSRITATEKKLKDKEQALKTALANYKKKKSNFENKINKAQNKIDSGWTKYNSLRNKFVNEQEPVLKDNIEKAEQGVEQLQAAYDMMPEESTLEQLNRAKATLEQLNKQYTDGKAKLSKNKKSLEASQAKLDKEKKSVEARLVQAKKKIDKGQSALEKAKKSLNTQKTAGYNKLVETESMLNSSQKQYDKAVALFEKEKSEGIDKINQGKEDYKEAKKKTDKKFALALKKIQNSEKKVKEQETPEWFVFNRDDNPGYSTFSQNADRLDAVASVFPVFFLLVAVLVCVTTMTRLIEEKRTEIGVLKALGYSNFSIIMKFVIYSLTAGMAGSIIGTLIGVSTLPFVIFNAYKIMYYIGDISLVVHIPSIVIGVAAAVVCTTAVSVIVCYTSLRQSTSSIMRPKAPKAGKRIFLERIKPLWSHMNFTAKLTSRNLLRYKSRLFMTVIGVAGCCALIVAAFGLLNSFVPLTNDQFETIYKYNTTVVPKESGKAQDLKYLTDVAEKDKNVKCYSLVVQEEATVEFKDIFKDDGTYIQVVENMKEINSIVSLHTRKGKKQLALDDKGVLINEKLAEEMGINVGDSITVGSQSKKARVTVKGIYEQYINNYIFMTPKMYRNIFNKEAEYNMMNIILSDTSQKAQKEFSGKCLKNEKIVAVSYVDSLLDDFKNMLKSLNLVVLVMIICAAALAFVVLYNLTNINIGERIREIATFKVLGFYNKETSAFIFIENIVLTVLGIGAGLILGIFLTDFIVETVEINNIMFGREIFPSTYLYAAALTMVFSLLVLFVMKFKIKAINMVESLKSIE